MNNYTLSWSEGKIIFQILEEMDKDEIAFGKGSLCT
jgi:hypothetical protein